MDEIIPSLRKAIRENDLDGCKKLVEKVPDDHRRGDLLRKPLSESLIHSTPQDVRIVNLLINSGADCDLLPCLFFAAQENNPALAEIFLSEGANPCRAYEENGKTPIFTAAAMGHNTVVSVLLKCTDDIPRDTRSGDTLLTVAAKENNIALAKIVLANYSPDTMIALLHMANRSHRMAIHEAIIMHGQRSVELVKVLLDAGTRPDVIDRDGFTPLIYSVLAKSEELIHALVESGADVNKLGAEGFTPLLAASKGDMFPAVKYLIEKGAVCSNQGPSEFAILKAAKYSSAETVRYLLQHGADPNKFNRDGKMPIHEAAYKGKAEVVSALLEAGVSVDEETRDDNGDTALILAAAQGHAHVVKVLVEAGVDLNYKNYKGFAAVHMAADKNKVEVIRALHQAHLAISLRKSETALQIAARRDYPDVILELQKLGESLTDRDRDRNTIIHIAARHNSIKVLEKFASKNFIFCHNKEGNLPLHLAAADDEAIEAVEILLKHHKEDTSVLLTNHQGNTPAHMAAEHNNKEILLKLNAVFDILLDRSHEDGDTVMHILARKGRTETLQEILEKYENKTALEKRLQMLNEKGETVLALAALHCGGEGITDLIKFLVEHGADLSEKGVDGQNIFHRLVKWFAEAEDAEERGRYEEVFKALLKKVVVWWCKDNNLEVPIRDLEPEVFLQCRRTAIVELTAQQNNQEGHTVLSLCCSLGVNSLYSILQNYETVYKLKDDSDNTYFDITNLTDETFEFSLEGQNIRQGYQKVDPFLRLMVNQANPADAAQLLQGEVVQQVIKDYITVYKVFYGMVTLFHVLYLSLYSAFSIDMFRLPRLNVSDVPIHMQFEKQLLDSKLAGTFLVSPSLLILVAPFLRLLLELYLAILYLCRRCAKPFGDPRASYFPKRRGVGTRSLEMNSMMTARARGIGNPMYISTARNATRSISTDVASVTRGVLLQTNFVSGLSAYYPSILRSSAKTSPAVHCLATAFHYILLIFQKILEFYFNNTLHIISCLFSIFQIIWYVLYALGLPHQEYILSLSLIAGWAFTLIFAKGFKGTRRFILILEKVFIRDIVRFIFVYLIFLFAFGLAIHVMFLTASVTIDNHKAPADTLFTTFNIMIGAADLFTDDFSEHFEGTIRGGFIKALFFCYAICATIILLNLLIAMVSDSYGEIEKAYVEIWQKDEMEMALNLEVDMHLFKPIFRSVRNSTLRSRGLAIRVGCLSTLSARGGIPKVELIKRFYLVRSGSGDITSLATSSEEHMQQSIAVTPEADLDVGHVDVKQSSRAEVDVARAMRSEVMRVDAVAPI